jgi:hypothetical protein
MNCQRRNIILHRDDQRPAGQTSRLCCSSLFVAISLNKHETKRAVYEHTKSERTSTKGDFSLGSAPGWPNVQTLSLEPGPSWEARNQKTLISKRDVRKNKNSKSLQKKHISCTKCQHTKEPALQTNFVENAGKTTVRHERSLRLGPAPDQRPAGETFRLYSDPRRGHEQEIQKNAHLNDRNVLEIVFSV